MLECQREINCLHRRQSYSFTHIVCPHPVAYNRRHIGKCCCLLLDDRWWWSSASVILQIDSSHWGKPTIIKVPLFRSLKLNAQQPNWRVVSSGRSDNHFATNEPTLKASRETVPANISSKDSAGQTRQIYGWYSLLFLTLQFHIPVLKAASLMAEQQITHSYFLQRMIILN